MTAHMVHRLDGLEPDNLLAFLALLGTLRALERVEAELVPRVSWSVDAPPLRPLLHLARAIDRETLTESVARGIDALARLHVFEGRADLNFTETESRSLLMKAAENSSQDNRESADLLAALMHDAAIKDGKERVIDPTPLCLLFGQGHQHFLERLEDIPKRDAPPTRGRGKTSAKVTAAQSISEALFDFWHRQDPTPSFRWDHREDVRYATMAGDPTDAAFKTGTQHGANRLAAVGLTTLKLAARTRAGRPRPVIVGGRRDADGFSMAWPVWHLPITLRAITALLAHPGIRAAGSLAHLGVIEVLVSSRISVGKFMSFTRARPLR